MSDLKLRNKTIQARLTEDEYKKIDEKAEHFGLSLSDYIRLVSLHSDIKISAKQSHFHCLVCGSREYIDSKGSGENVYGEFEDYVCECGNVVRVYYK